MPTTPIIFKMKCLSLLIIICLPYICYSQTFGLAPKTVAAIITTLEQRGEVVTTVGNAYDRSAHLRFVILKRENGKLNFTLLRTIGGGADEIVSDPNLVNSLPRYVNYNIAEYLTKQLVEDIILSQGGLEQFRVWVAKNPKEMSKYAEMPRKFFEMHGISIKKDQSP